MDEIERRLSEILHEATPEPPMTMTPADIERLTRHADPRETRVARRWTGPLLAAAIVILFASATTLVVHQHGRGSQPPVGGITGPATTRFAPSTPATTGHITPSDHTSPSPSTSTTGPAQTSRTGPSPSTVTSGTSATSGTATISPPATTCPTSGLTLTQGPTTNAAGSSFATFYLINTASRICTIQGFPGVSFLDRNANPLGQPAVRAGAQGPNVVIPIGGHAQFTVQINSATQTGCTVAMTASLIQVYPPNQRTALRIPLSKRFCTLSVTAVSR